ncbi:endonuclease/exonuclease/phosphatase family protein [Vagococcus sp. DIV0080]|uniref:Endonuclease/exonuclease/phosphatase family protein n=1 Tax=Candidatus Vagococcus giribetii TaxID=2230876 RepID=A0ABS3HUU6_9ENTE|nr:endonuclease/exonuclease/phosphatase family protein [Vagococcus sp. DIV0080]MBO0477526.1 endonuclease/exonuclease/phosphatase family protein [Vagococcus sp. DIV0080]
MNYLYWNSNKKNNDKYVIDLVIENDIDFLILAEFPADDVNKLLIKINLNYSKKMYKLPILANNKLVIFSTLTVSQFDYLEESNHVRFLRFTDLDINMKINLGMLHFPSKLYNGEDELNMVVIETNNMIDRIDNSDLESKTILIGDFNMNPFEKGMLSTSGFHAFPRKIETEKLKRTVLSVEKKMFYNPMWKYLITEDNPIGSYYYSPNKAYALFWQVFDQVLLRPEFIPFINFVGLVTSTTKYELIAKGKVPDRSISDHLPVILKLKELSVENG